ncbi:hydroxyacid dehydrogenase [candidate division KSB1 bacterium]
MKELTVLLYEPMRKEGIAVLEEYCEVIYPESVEEESILEHAPKIDGIVIRANGKVSEKIINSSPKLKVIGRHGIGVENIDIETATQRGIWVVNTPESNAESVAEHFMMFALNLSKKFIKSFAELKNGNWNSRYIYTGTEIFGKTVGIIGFGRIGRTIACHCHSAFSCPIIYYDIKKYPEEEEKLGAKPVSLNELLNNADYISLNTPLTKETHHLIGKNEISLMKPTTFLINTSRGKVWDEKAVYEALIEKRIAGAASDVFEDEPTTIDNPLFKLDNFIATPHMGSHTEEALMRMSLVAEDIITVLKGGKPKYPVNSV